MNIFF